jgi:hypothetical protein
MYQLIATDWFANLTSLENEGRAHAWFNNAHTWASNTLPRFFKNKPLMGPNYVRCITHDEIKVILNTCFNHTLILISYKLMNKNLSYFEI